MLKWGIALVTLAFIVRILFIFQGGVSFHYDMARDAFEAQQIWRDHHLKILGPPTSTPGLFHGVFYYYLIAPFYMFGSGDPRVVAIFLSFINCLTIVPIMLLAKDFFKARKWVILSGLLFAVSFEAVQYAPWISDPSPAMLTIALFFYFLRAWQKGNRLGLYFAVFMAALSTQFEFFFLYLFILIPVFLYIFKIRIYLKDIFISSLIATLGLSSFFIATFKFNSWGLALNGFANIFTPGQLNFRMSFSEQFLNYINKLTELFINNFFPVNVFLGGLLMFVVLYFVRKEKFILFCLFSSLPIYIFGGHSNVYVNAGLVVPAILGVVIVLRYLNRYLSLLIIGLIIISNIYAIFKYSPQGQIMLVIPADMNLKNELRLIDETYKIASGKPFSINSLTLPLWTNTTWAYLYSWYGKDKYGYTPYFYGRDQVGLLGVKSMERIEKPLDKTFFIIEPGDGIPQRFYQEELDTENSKTKLIKEIKYGSIKLQVRSPITNTNE
ncbi:hypothetical protein KKE78_00225 [Patescibacteria group bacterium]|nr:hypothetical protein [Patescibacteria group bacterium]